MPRHDGEWHRALSVLNSSIRKNHLPMRHDDFMNRNALSARPHGQNCQDSLQTLRAARSLLLSIK
jgi:hypothetical protein